VTWQVRCFCGAQRAMVMSCVTRNGYVTRIALCLEQPVFAPSTCSHHLLPPLAPSTCSHHYRTHHLPISKASVCGEVLQSIKGMLQSILQPSGCWCLCWHSWLLVPVLVSMAAAATACDTEGLGRHTTGLGLSNQHTLVLYAAPLVVSILSLHPRCLCMSCGALTRMCQLRTARH